MQPRARGRVGRIFKPFGTSPSSCANSRRRRHNGPSREGQEKHMGQKVNPIGFASASTAPGIRGGLPARRVWHAAARGYQDPQGPEKELKQAAVSQDRHRTPAQEVPGDDPFGAPRRRHRQEGRRYRETAPQVARDDRQRSRASTSSKSASRKSTPNWSPKSSPISSNAASLSAAP